MDDRFPPGFDRLTPAQQTLWTRIHEGIEFITWPDDLRNALVSADAPRADKKAVAVLLGGPAAGYLFEDDPAGARSTAGAVDQVSRHWVRVINSRAVRTHAGQFLVHGVQATCAEAHQLRQVLDGHLATEVGGEVLLTEQGIEALGPTR
jgi:hypothetical protein